MTIDSFGGSFKESVGRLREEGHKILAEQVKAGTRKLLGSLPSW